MIEFKTKHCIVAESDLNAAVDVLKSNLQDRKRSVSFNGRTANNGDDARTTQQILSDCTNHLVQLIHETVQPLPDEEFHKYVFKKYEDDENETSTQNTNANKVVTKPEEIHLEDSLSSSLDADFPFEEEDLIDTAALEQARNYREQVRLQAQVNDEKRSRYIKQISMITERKLALLVQKTHYEHSKTTGINADSCNHSGEHCSIMDSNANVDGVTHNDQDQLHQDYNQEIQLLKNKLTSLKESVQQFCGTDNSRNNVTSQWLRMNETIQEIERHFFIVDGEPSNNGLNLNTVQDLKNQHFVLSSQPLSQVDKAIQCREDDDEDEIERVKNSILYSVAAFSTGDQDESGLNEVLTATSPNKVFLSLMSKSAH